MYRRSFITALGALALAATEVQALRAATLPTANIELGDDVFLRSEWEGLAGRCVGIITNQTGVTSRLVNIVDAVKANRKICLKAIYSPEHGLRGDRPAGAYVSSYVDDRTGLPVYSLYGPQKHPTPQMLDGVEVLLFDIQDVGARPYTFVSTMAYAMQAAASYGKEIWILDRPNPIGGEMVEGPVLDPQFKSFIGLYPIAMRHGMTVGELARMFNDHFGIGAGLHVVKMEGWQRSMFWPDTGLQWVQTSPNIPEWSTTVVYPCTGLVDSFGLNGGVGTTRPFKYTGAAGMDAYRFASILNARNVPGVYFRPAYWSPFFGFLANKQIAGVELDVFDPRAFPSVETAVHILTAAREVDPHQLVYGTRGEDIDWGTDTLWKGLKAGYGPEQILEEWQPAVARFKDLRANYLLYD
ncbi:MAG TPA: DUF1343 domain-containing protein [Candidatus Baltobacteraceae bacterium]|nr:DUF1343 domain-containing protein [Candidatus Baltobacteraceae bacterium]